MELTKERKILLAVTAVAALGVMADRVLLSGSMSGPKSADASTAAVAPSAAAAGGAVTTPKPVASLLDVNDTPTESLASRLERVRPGVASGSRNAFTVPATWRPADAQRPSVETVSGFNPESFARRHPLEAVTTQGDRRSAVVAGNVVTLGETVEGMTLSDIDDGSVIWSGHGVRVRVRLHPR